MSSDASRRGQGVYAVEASDEDQGPPPADLRTKKPARIGKPDRIIDGPSLRDLVEVDGEVLAIVPNSLKFSEGYPTPLVGSVEPVHAGIYVNGELRAEVMPDGSVVPIEPERVTPNRRSPFNDGRRENATQRRTRDVGGTRLACDRRDPRYAERRHFRQGGYPWPAGEERRALGFFGGWFARRDSVRRVGEPDRRTTRRRTVES